MANENERCDKCRHFFKPPNSHPGCRRYPPYIVEPREEQRSTFPNVMPDWTCGEFSPAIALTS